MDLTWARLSLCFGWNFAMTFFRYKCIFFCPCCDEAASGANLNLTIWHVLPLLLSECYFSRTLTSVLNWGQSTVDLYTETCPDSCTWNTNFSVTHHIPERNVSLFSAYAMVLHSHWNYTPESFQTYLFIVNKFSTNVSFLIPQFSNL